MDTVRDKQVELMMQEHFHFIPNDPSSFAPMASWIHEERDLQQSMMAADDLDQAMSKEKRKGGKRGAGVRLSTDPQSVAARQRRHRISDRFRVLKSLVPGGSKMDTVSMLEEAIHYVKFLKAQIWLHQAALMLPADHESHAINACNFAVPESAGMASTSGVVGRDAAMAYAEGGNYKPFTEETMMYSLPAPAPALPSFPYCSFQQVVEEEEEETLPHHGFFNY